MQFTLHKDTGYPSKMLLLHLGMKKGLRLLLEASNFLDLLALDLLNFLIDFLNLGINF